MTVAWTPEVGWTDEPTLDYVRSFARTYAELDSSHVVARVMRDVAVRECYQARNATLGQLAQATGLSPQRIHQIVREES